MQNFAQRSAIIVMRPLTELKNILGKDHALIADF
jgi:hypothetical protein